MKRKPTGAPVLVELFTSEGCSSCPPADALLARLAATQPVSGARIIALGQHVDYWDRLGWRDPFSSPDFTRRQVDYMRSLRIPDVYTPQVVVDGRVECLGSNEAQVRRGIVYTARLLKATVTLDAAGSGAFRVTVADLPPRTGASEVYLAVVEDGLANDVRAGENNGRRLSHIAVARSLQRIGQMDRASRFAATVTPGRTALGNRQNARLIAFVQETATRHVVGASDKKL